MAKNGTQRKITVVWLPRWLAANLPQLPLYLFLKIHRLCPREDLLRIYKQRIRAPFISLLHLS